MGSVCCGSPENLPTNELEDLRGGPAHTGPSLKRGDTASFQGGKCEVLDITTTDALLKMPNGSEKWCDLEDVKLEQACAHALKLGDTASYAGKHGVVVDVNTTDVMLKMADGSQKWHDLEDVALVKSSIPTLRRGDTAGFSGGKMGTVLDVSTTDVKLKMKDGTEKWCDKEDLHQIKEGQPLTKGAGVKVSGKEGTIVDLHTTDAKVKFKDGSEKWCDLDDIDPL